MRPLPDNTTLVLAGAFNPAILVPQWIALNALDIPAGQDLPVQMMAPVGPGFGQAAKYMFAGLSYSPGFQNLTFYLEGDNNGQRVCDVAARILGLLPHTPISGVGFNFGYMEENPGVQLLELLQSGSSLASALGEGTEVVSRSWGNVSSWEGALVSTRAEIRGGSVTVDFNFHYSVQTAGAAATILGRTNIFDENRKAAARIIELLTDEQ
jgi:hypothetical protein